MRKCVKGIIGLAATSILIAAGVIKLGSVVRPIDADAAIRAIHAFHKVEENSVEVIGYGSSHMWRGMSSMRLYDQYGIGAYNYGCNWQQINTSLLFLEDSFRTQTPKVVVIDTLNVNVYKEDVNVDGEIYYTTAIPDFEGKRRYLKQCFGNDMERYLAYYVPLCAFHENWTSISLKSILTDNVDIYDYQKHMGFAASEAVCPTVIPDQTLVEQKSLSEGALEILDKIVALCREHNTSVLFITIPWDGEFAYSNAMKMYAQEQGCSYINLFEYINQMNLNADTDFFDSNHLNTAGATKVADFVGQYLKEHYELTDFRNVPGNQWEEAKCR